MDITQKFYDSLSAHYDKLFLDWEKTCKEEADLLNGLFEQFGFGREASILDCACGIGTQAIGLAKRGYRVCASDISLCELAEAKKRAKKAAAEIRFEAADFRALAEAFDERFDILIAMDNALPHMLSSEELEKAVKSITGQIRENGIFIGSIRDYDALLKDKPTYAPPYIHQTAQGKRISFQTWAWEGECYRLTQYIIEDEAALQINKFECEYRATRREELTALFKANGCYEVIWLMPEETGFYQPIFAARKGSADK